MDPVSGLMLMLMGGILVVVAIPFLYENWKKSHHPSK